jgi:elongation factor Tu
MAKKKFERTKPHVNVGTIGHIDHGKTTLTSAITTMPRQIRAGRSWIPFDQIDKAPEEKERGITIATAHVEYETDKTPLRTRGLPGPRRLYQEHDHRSCPDGRRHPGRRCKRRSHAPDKRAYPPCPSGRCPLSWSSISTRSDMVDDPELIELVEMELRELLTSYEFPGDDSPHHQGIGIKGTGTRLRETELPDCKSIYELSMRRLLYPGACPRYG